MSHRYADAIESKLVAKRMLDLWLERGIPAATGEPGRATRLKRAASERVFIGCDSYYWDRTLLGAVIESAKSLPLDTTVSMRELPDAGWMWFSSGVGLSGADEGEHARAILWFVFTDESLAPHLTVMEFQEEGRRGDGFYSFLGPLATLPTAHAVVPIGMTLGEIADATPTSGHVDLLIRAWVATTLWMEQRIIVARDEPVERACRRRLERGGTPAQSLRVIQIRRAEAAVHPGAQLDDGHYSCRWIVRGHWRQQFYPSTNENRPRWIMPYVKGPEDAPLKTPAPTVFAVTR